MATADLSERGGNSSVEPRLERVPAAGEPLQLVRVGAPLIAVERLVPGVKRFALDVVSDLLLQAGQLSITDGLGSMAFLLARTRRRRSPAKRNQFAGNPLHSAGNPTRLSGNPTKSRLNGRFCRRTYSALQALSVVCRRNRSKSPAIGSGRVMPSDASSRIGCGLRTNGRAAQAGAQISCHNHRATAIRRWVCRTSRR